MCLHRNNMMEKELESLRSRQNNPEVPLNIMSNPSGANSTIFSYSALTHLIRLSEGKLLSYHCNSELRS